jgi:pyruvate,water dikinase
MVVLEDYGLSETELTSRVVSAHRASYKITSDGIIEEVWREVYGGKAAGLLRLYRLGHRIPNTFIVPEHADVNEVIDVIAEFDEDCNFTPGINPPRLWAVRSSGRGEDGEEMSYAGQHLTELNVELEDIPAAIERCRDSEAWSAPYVKAIENLVLGVGGKVEKKGMCVVVQEMVQAKYAGVLFTADPESGRRDVSVLEFVKGLGDGLVSGTEMPEESFKVVSSLYPNWDLNWRSIFSNVVEMGRRLHNTYGPVDIEWAIDKEERLYFLQVRPLTALPPEPILEEGVIAINTGEIVKGVVGRIPGPVFKKGQILVTKMTDPRMINAMLKAKAIVTEIGGRTCHAAVVSRELGLPCLVGYELASKLYTGDVVEVDTKEREVRKIG